MAASAVRAVIRIDTEPRPIPVARHRLPRTAELAPYLARIDQERWSSHAGPLAREFETKLAARFDNPTGVVTFAEPGAAITLALRALDCAAGELCAMPSWTAAVTAHAVAKAGLEPWFLDVDPVTWMLEPAATVEALPTAPGPVGAILPCAAFGRLPDLNAWARVARYSGIPVLLDAQGGVDGLTTAPIPVAVGLGPAECVSAGGGGFLVSDDGELIERIGDLVAAGDRSDPACDTQLSDYSAATGLASLDAWPETRRRLAFAAQNLKVALALTPQIIFQPGWGSAWMSGQCVVGVPDGAAPALAASLAARGVDTRAWWAGGRHADPAFAHCLRHSVPVTEHLAASTLGLPFFTELDEETSWRIVDALIEALKEI